MPKPVRHETLMQAVHNTVKVYTAAAVFSILFIVFVPSWIRWIWFTVCGAVLLVSILASFVEDWAPKGRVSATSKAVVITGCDSGFGHKLAQKLDDLGLQVFAGCLNPEGEGAKNLKKSASSRLQLLPLDVTSEESVEKFQKQVAQKIKDNKLWAVVNNAGLNDGAEIFWTNLEVIQRVIDVNTFGTVRVTKAFLPMLCKSKGRVVTVTSAAALNTYVGMVPYCMSKVAAKSFCEGLRLEMYRFGVKVVTIEPWMYRTPLINEDTVTKYIVKTWDQAPEEIKEFYPKDYINHYTKFVLKVVNYSTSDKPQQVVDCLEEAVMALNPKYSYNPGTFHSRFSFWILRKLPKQFVDFVLQELFPIK